MLAADELERLRADLLAWFSTYKRDLPWRRTRDPYAIWVSEIMLQQTRVAAAIPYYERFLARFPGVRELADATEPELLAYWAGLGYYYRARNLQNAARRIRDAGAFPASHHEIRKLPGIGEYTAAAVASIAFDLPHAVLDGNVLRVLSRLFNDETNIASARGRKYFAELAEKLLDRATPGDFNQAVMELGATVCLPKNPQCLLCPVSGYCQARKSGRCDQLPVKLVERKRVEQTRIVFWIERQGQLLVWQRPVTSRLMPGFWELPEPTHLKDTIPGRRLGSFRHTITFHNYRFDIEETEPPARIEPCQWIAFEGLVERPLSTILKKAQRVVQRSREMPKELARGAITTGMY